jgi:hypothetical protein
MTYKDALENIRNHKNDCDESRTPCPQLPGTIFRVFIPAGAVVNFLNLIELTSPSGICIILRLPFLGGMDSCSGPSSIRDLAGLMDAVKQAGGSIEVVNQ